MLHGKDEDIDLVLANWLIAADIPELRSLTREAYFKQIESLTEQVRQDMATQASGRHRSNPNSPMCRAGAFAYAIHKLGFAYNEEFHNEDLSPAETRALYGDADNIFLVGLLRTHRGSCVSMPLIYLVIGQRLGFPICLVAIGKHYFIRWEEPGFYVNIEPTIIEDACLTDDSTYLDVEGMTRDQLKGSDLQDLTNREVVGQLFFARYGYWFTKMGKRETQACLDLSRARHLSPNDPGIKAAHQRVFNFYGIKPEQAAIDIRIKLKE